LDLTVDTSVIVAVVLNEPSKAGLVAATRGAELIVPASLHWEVGNALSALFKRRRIDLEQARAALESYDKIPLRLAEIDLEASVSLADRYGIYAYDAYVIECARRYQTPLLSLDGAQCQIARREGVDILEAEL
jgi:predicted nucleic acid-binding protein